MGMLRNKQQADPAQQLAAAACSPPLRYGRPTVHDNIAIVLLFASEVIQLIVRVQGKQ
jgi:hypothetical protein